MIEAKTYNLPDYMILHHDKDADYHIWQPDKTYVVLGRSNRITEESVYVHKVMEDSIEVYKRPSGGEAVVLSPNMLVISVKLPLLNKLRTHRQFSHINHSITKALEKAGIRQLNSKGISDIAIGMKKILGSSIYRTEKSVFYHAVLNISEPVSTISKYLKHPSREPDYRKGRNHTEFVTSVMHEGFRTDIESLKILLQESLEELIAQKKAPEELLN